MKIRYLGTAAYDAIPALFCQCDTCMRARALGGRNIRSRCQALVNEDLLLDFNPDTVMHFQRDNIDCNKIDYCLITHSHEDHLYPSDMMIPRFSAKPHKVRYFVGKAGYEIIEKEFHRFPAMLNPDLAEVTEIEPFTEFSVGPYRVLSVKGQHDPTSSPLLYAIEQDGKRLLYAHDTGIFLEETIEALRKFGKFDMISLDCTGAVGAGDWVKDHMNLANCGKTMDRFRREGIADGQTICVLSHFSHNGWANYDELLEPAKKYGFLVAYDGMTLEF